MLAIIRCRISCLPVCYPKNTQINVYRNMLLLSVLYGCETWSLTMKDHCSLTDENAACGIKALDSAIFVGLCVLSVRTAAAAVLSKPQSHYRVFVSLTELDWTRLDKTRLCWCVRTLRLCENWVMRIFGPKRGEEETA
jgi:hypothetical protein